MGKEKKEKEDRKIIASEGSIIRITILISLLICTAAFGGFLAGASKTVDKIIYNHATGEKNKNYIGPAEDTTQEEQAVAPKWEENPKALDLSKSLNSIGKTYSNAKETEEDLGLKIKINGDKVSLVTEPKFCNLAGLSICGPEAYETSITGFTKTIKTGFVGEVGQDVKGTILFYLMDDGTVEYTRVFGKAEDSNGNFYYVLNTVQEEENGKIVGSHYATQGKVAGVKGVYKLYLADVSGYRTTIAATKDGSFYDLGEALNK